MIQNKSKYIHVEDFDQIFHKTKYTNILAERATTPFVAVWDADVIAEPLQILDSVNKRRKGEAYMAYPYDGRFLDTSDTIRSLYIRNSNIACLDRYSSYMDLLYGDESKGAAVFLNYEKWKLSGMDDEKFYGWGNEDVERYYRFQKWAFPIYRSRGILYHLSHPRDLNGRFRSLKYYLNSNEWLAQTMYNPSGNEKNLKISENIKQFCAYLIILPQWVVKNEKTLKIQSASLQRIIQINQITLKADYEYYQRRYGFELSPSEIQNFSAHHAAWQQFIRTDARWCAIVESNVELEVMFDLLFEQITKLPNDWDVFFPYTKENARQHYLANLYNSDEHKIKYWLGFIFGNSIYFLSRKGAAKLVTIDIIKDRLDHTLLTMNNLNRYMEQVPWFSLEQVEAYEWPDRKEVKPTTDCP